MELKSGRLVAGIWVVAVLGAGLVGGACGSDDVDKVFDMDAAPEARNPFDDPSFQEWGGVWVDEGIPKNAPDLFAAASPVSPTGGPCLIEPELNSLYPSNWLRPRFTWIAPEEYNVFELKVRVSNQQKDLLVYTPLRSWTMPFGMWRALVQQSASQPIEITVRAGRVVDDTKIEAVSLGSTGPLRVAPVEAPGSIVYWAINKITDTAVLRGFTVGEETVHSALKPDQLQEKARCVGCHTATPDGRSIMVSVPENWENRLASVEDGGLGLEPAYIKPESRTALKEAPLGISSFSKAHWADGDRTVISTDGKEIVWVDLEGKGGVRGILPRTSGVPMDLLAAAPAWSHNGETIAYVATNRPRDGRIGTPGFEYGIDDDIGSRADIYTVPYNNRAGGATAGLPGASNPNVQEYYPAYSPDDKWIAYNVAPNDRNLYDQKSTEVYVIPSHGGTPVRLAANDPPACSGKKSPGVTNSWPKWSPAVQSKDGKTYYFLVFSSRRGTTGVPQLYITPVVVDADGKVETFAALYLWNQPNDEGNHTPVWDNFELGYVSPK